MTSRKLSITCQFVLANSKEHKMTSICQVCLLVLLSLVLASSKPLARQKRSTEANSLGDLTAGASGILNQDYVKLPTCKHIYDSGLTTSGLYKLNLDDGMGEFTVFCDMTLRGGGWTVFQRRVDNTTSFSKTNSEYKIGFGNFNKNFWLGLEHIKRIINFGGLTFELHVGMQKFPSVAGNEFGFVHYPSFSVDTSSQNYKITIAAYDDTVSTTFDSLNLHTGSSFSTSDNDQDGDSTQHCASDLSSGWWFDNVNCGISNLNGIYYHDGTLPTSTHDGLHWSSFDQDSSLKTTVMAIRPA